MERYIAITPARDEEQFLPGLIASMAAQTRLPERWIVIDDGSADGTGKILDRAARRRPGLGYDRRDARVDARIQNPELPPYPRVSSPASRRGGRRLEGLF